MGFWEEPHVSSPLGAVRAGPWASGVEHLASKGDVLKHPPHFQGTLLCPSPWLLGLVIPRELLMGPQGQAGHGQTQSGKISELRVPPTLKNTQNS